MALTRAEYASIYRARQRGELPMPTYSICASCGAKRKDSRVNPLHGDLCARCWRKSPDGRDAERERILQVARRRSEAEYAARIKKAGEILQSIGVKRFISENSDEAERFYGLLDSILQQAESKR